MTLQQYWQRQEQSRGEQIVALESELRGLSPIDAPLRQLERRAKRSLRRYLRASVRRATGRILRHHPDGIFRSFSIARRLRRFVLKQCRVRMEIWIGSSGDLEYPELVDTLPALPGSSHEARARNLDLARAHNLAPFLALDYGSTRPVFSDIPECGMRGRNVMKEQGRIWIIPTSHALLRSRTESPQT